MVPFASVVSFSARAAFEVSFVSRIGLSMTQLGEQRCQAISETHEIAMDILKDMVSILPVPETLRGKIQEEETRKSLMDFLELIKDTMDVLMRYAAYSTASACSFTKFRT